MRRREFISLLGGAAAAWSVGARAEQAAMPVIGLLRSTASDTNADLLGAFRKGLKETGYVEGENVVFEYRWAENQVERLPELAADLVRRQVARAPPSAFAAKTATTSIPIVFVVAEDPVRLSLVASLARPGGNLTGINFFAVELAAKRLELLRELVPTAVRVAVIVNPANASITEGTLQAVEIAARTTGMRIQVFNANTSREIDAAFESLAHERPDVLFVSSGPFFSTRRLQLSQWATRHALPAVFAGREYAEAGGLISYGASLFDAYRQAGVYTGRILKGAKPADLPVLQSTKLELVVNVQTARILGIQVPPSLLSIADEVIE